MTSFFKLVNTLQWDDHRYYHQSRINQTLYLVSAFCFLTAYVLLFTDHAAAGIVGWTLGLAWACKIMLDPFHNIAIYWRSPIALLKGESLDPIH